MLCPGMDQVMKHANICVICDSVYFTCFLTLNTHTRAQRHAMWREMLEWWAAPLQAVGGFSAFLKGFKHFKQVLAATGQNSWCPWSAARQMMKEFKHESCNKVCGLQSESEPNFRTIQTKAVQTLQSIKSVDNVNIHFWTWTHHDHMIRI